MGKTRSYAVVAPQHIKKRLYKTGFYLEIFPIIENLKPGKSGELWLPDAIGQLIKIEKVLACEIKDATYYDTGNKLEYMKTIVEFGLRHPDVNGEFRQFLKSLDLK